MKNLIKNLIFVPFFIIIDIPLYIIYKILFLSSDKAFTTFSELLSLIPGYPGYFIRQGFYILTLGMGKNVNIRFGTILEHPTIRINDDVYIGQNCTIGTATIHNGVKIGSNVDILSGGKTHEVGKDGKVMPTKKENLKRIQIGKDSWIGNSAVVMASVGKNSIIGAGAVVVKPIPPKKVAAGNPAKIIKDL